MDLIARFVHELLVGAFQLVVGFLYSVAAVVWVFKLLAAILEGVARLVGLL